LVGEEFRLIAAGLTFSSEPDKVQSGRGACPRLFLLNSNNFKNTAGACPLPNLSYLQRTCDPEICDAEGFNFWLNKINSRLSSTDADYNEMIRAFLRSTEYRSRLGLS
jgi:hypothetical protein